MGASPKSPVCQGPRTGYLIANRGGGGLLRRVTSCEACEGVGEVALSHSRHPPALPACLCCLTGIDQKLLVGLIDVDVVDGVPTP